jgi:tryptophan synthase alpha chain
MMIPVRSRITRRFQTLHSQNRGGLITFITAGDPDFDTSYTLLQRLPAAGADIIELGIPFSDPIADGPTIQAANLRALNAGITLAKTLSLVRFFRNYDQDTPLILMGYFNPIHAFGVQHFLAEALAVGVFSILSSSQRQLELSKDIFNIILLATPTTDDLRLPVILNLSSGFIYYVSVTGITGTKLAIQSKVVDAVARLRRYTALPIAVGFGIRTPEQAAGVVSVADAVVVGSAIVEQIASGKDIIRKVTTLVSQLARAVRSQIRTV